tara:strand:+ start:1697 stop:2431 length:735 start_codon:yes stop_codon:yes gene_type:complete
MIQVIHRALDILELILKNNNKGMPLREIADSLHLNHSTCANILKTLTSRKYLVKSTTDRNYKIGPMLISMMSDNSQSYKLIRAAESPMRELSKLTNECCMLGMLKDNIRITLHEELVEHDLNVISKREKPAYQTSSGRVILAYLSEVDRMKFVKEHGLPIKDVWPEVRDINSLMLELDNIRENKFAKQVSASHVLGLAVALVQENGFIAALGIYLPEVRFTGERESVIVKALFSAQKSIYKNLQ